MSNKAYKTTRKYKCPYCDFRATRDVLVSHVQNKHEELIPEGYTAARAVYDFINGKNYGTCMICKAKVYEWNDKINKYYNLCQNNPSCRARVREIALERHMRVYNKPTLLNDPEQQEKMLQNRKISGSYIFSDGGKVPYTGTYEKNALEFMDKVLNIPSKDIQAPGPVLEYEYNGETHKWITDIYYIPANLLIEIKDGGSNPNNRPMQSYRDKQIAKETMVTNLGTFNYIRLTNNQFYQLLDILVDMKNEALTNENPRAKIHINEAGGCGGTMPPNRPPEAYIVPYGMNNVFDGVAYGDSNTDSMITISSDGVFERMDKETFNEKYTAGYPLYYTGDDIEDRMKAIYEALKTNKTAARSMFLAEILAGHPIPTYQKLFLEKCFRYYDKERENEICSLIENGVVNGLENQDSNVIKSIGNVMICQGTKGYFAVTPGDFYMASEYFDDIETLMSSEVVNLMNNVYLANRGRKDNRGDEDEQSI